MASDRIREGTHREVREPKAVAASRGRSQQAARWRSGFPLTQSCDDQGIVQGTTSEVAGV